MKIVLMEDFKIVNMEKMGTMTFYRDYCNFDGKVVVDLKKFGLGQIDRAVSTGYGRNNTDLNEFKAINEIKAHVYGAICQTGLNDFILLDIGGQDVKAVKVEKGLATDLELSCGRYLENMANVLEISLDELSRHIQNPIELNSTCAVFSESELIGKIAEGTSIDRLCAGVNYSLYKRLRPILTNFKGERLVLTGGVAYNDAIKEYLTNDYEQIIAVDEPQYNGAIGCCYYGNRK